VSEMTDADGQVLADPEPDAELMTAGEACAEAMKRERVLRDRVILARETVASLRSAQAPAEGEIVDDVDARALGCTMRLWLRTLDRLGRELGRWAPEPQSSESTPVPA
jgi:hypothetical protein